MQTIEESNNEVHEGSSKKESENQDDGVRRPHSFEDKSPGLLTRNKTFLVKSNKNSLINDDEFRNKMRIAWRKQVNQKRKSTISKSHLHPINTNESEEAANENDYDNLTRSRT